jgi:hypothetical protein
MHGQIFTKNIVGIVSLYIVFRSKPQFGVMLSCKLVCNGLKVQILQALVNKNEYVSHNEISRMFSRKCTIFANFSIFVKISKGLRFNHSDVAVL